MAFLVGQKAPDFTAKAVMPDNTFKEISLSSYRGKYVLLFFYPMDFTFVCPSEILAFNRKLDRFREKDCEVIGVSTDSEFSHLAWKNTPVEKGGIGNVQFPLVADITKQISREYGTLLDEAIALRGVYLIDKEGIVRHMTLNDDPVGRNIDEEVRTLEALQYTEKHGQVCPANWKEGEDAMDATPEGVADYLSKHGK